MSDEDFAAGDTVYALDAGKKYEAKVLKAQMVDGVMQYFIHFQGWNRRWDKWVPITGIQKFTENEQGVGRSGKPLNDSSSVEEVLQPKRKSRGSSSNEEENLKKKRLKNLMANDLDDDAEVDTANETKKLIKLEIPQQVKKLLVDEYEMITQDPKHLHRLPRPKGATVAAVISDFLAMKQKKSDANQMERYKALFDALLLYFDKVINLLHISQHFTPQPSSNDRLLAYQALPLILLYRQEREQAELVHSLYQDKDPDESSTSTSIAKWDLPCSEIYGSEHLLRLFVRLPQLFASAPLSDGEMTQVQGKLAELLKFIHKHSETYILPQEYLIADEAVKELQKKISDKRNKGAVRDEPETNPDVVSVVVS